MIASQVRRLDWIQVEEIWAQTDGPAERTVLVPQRGYRPTAAGG